MEHSFNSYMDYLHQKAGEQGVPIFATFELTSRCNFNCKMCYIHNSDCNKNKSLELSTKQWLKIAEDAKNAGVVFLLLTGGELLLRDDFAELYTAFCEMGFVVYINTNASLITEDIFALFDEYPPSRLNISLYGGSGDAYKDICGVDSFEKVIANIKRLKAMDIEVRISCTLTRYNEKEAERIIELSKELDCEVRSTTYIYPKVRREGFSVDDADDRLPPAEAASLMLRTEKAKRDDETFLKFCKSALKSFEQSEKNTFEVTEKRLEMRCRAGRTCFWVDWQGNMSSCGMITQKSINLPETPFEKAWNKVRENTKKVRMPEKCVNCKYRILCNICAAKTISETGRSDIAPQYACEYCRQAEILINKILSGEDIQNGN